MNPAYVLARGRARRTVLMGDTVTVARTTGNVFDESTGTYTPATSTVYTGAADVKPRPVASNSNMAQSGERAVTTFDYDVAIPWTSTVVFHEEDRITVTTSNDPTFVGLVLTVVDVEHGGRRTAHHLTAEART